MLWAHRFIWLGKIFPSPPKAMAWVILDKNSAFAKLGLGHPSGGKRGLAAAA